MLRLEINSFDTCHGCICYDLKTLMFIIRLYCVYSSHMLQFRQNSPLDRLTSEKGTSGAFTRERLHKSGNRSIVSICVARVGRRWTARAFAGFPCVFQDKVGALHIFLFRCFVRSKGKSGAVLYLVHMVHMSNNFEDNIQGNAGAGDELRTYKINRMAD
ncbi:hypothetical protein MARPO_0078s0025 [Marchantia polymorpha]|uniref:Uncharacterized protein n=1 Tax=Marchantia polymorpha TaxID=3197 RepID=A0A2R6WLC9_MARPO|nr:hypothetical protein MARPO_0078s0025 [Marchantia polymorpha]|eukprot:PTQ34613.1 hypothetical protein MARPO_0078s0025 [Marchantia polymorpha]